MDIDTERSRDLMVMAFAIQFTVIGTAGSAWAPLAVVGVLVSAVVAVREGGRRLSERSTE